MAWNYYFKDRTGAQNGPVSIEELKSLIRAGRIAPDCLVWPEGGEPAQAGAIPLLFEDFAHFNSGGGAQGLAGGGPLQGSFSGWGLFWRSIVAGLGIILIVPAPWAGPWLYGWIASRVSLPNGRALRLESGAAPLFFFLALAVIVPAVVAGGAAAYDPAAARSGGIIALRLVGQIASIIFSYLLVRWFSRALRSEDGAFHVAFEGGFWAYLGWEILLILSVFTIIGWAWVLRYRTRWICRRTVGTHAFEFTGTGWGILGVALLTILGSLLIVTAPWLIAWFYNWFISKIIVTPAAENPALAQRAA
jgi:hypothetical protein